MPEARVRHATSADAAEIGRLLHDFNSEFSEPVPEPAVIAERVGRLLDEGEITALLAGEGPYGIAVLRFRPALYRAGPDAYLEELYVTPGMRRRGLGRALMEEALATARRAGAAGMELGTEEDDTAARALYESLGFTNRGGKPDGPVSYFYEIEF